MKHPEPPEAPPCKNCGKLYGEHLAVMASKRGAWEPKKQLWLAIPNNIFMCPIIVERSTYK